MSVPATNGSAPVYEHIEEDETEYMPDVNTKRNASYSARAYMFDAAVQTRPHAPDGIELDIPSMPAPSVTRLHTVRRETNSRCCLQALTLQAVRS